MPPANARTPAKATAKSPAKPKSRGKGVAETAGEQKIAPAKDWREATLERMRSLILEVDPKIIEERKWKKPSNAMVGVPVWSRDGIICTGESYAKVVKLTFAQGASLPDPSGLFNASLEGNMRRAIDIREGEQIDAVAFKALIKAAVAHNSPAEKSAKAKPSASAAKPRAASAKSAAGNSKPVKPQKAKAVVLLTGGNPQIAKAEGDAPVQAYIAALPGWKRDLGQRLDALITRTLPNVNKAVKWNSPFYGIQGQGWFLGFHAFTHYLKINFFRGTSLRPIPPGPSKGKEARYLDIREHDALDEAQLANWVKQAAALPGWAP